MPGWDRSLREAFSWVLPTATQALGLAAAAGELAVAGALAGLGAAGGDGGPAEDAAQVPVAFLVPGLAFALAGLLVQRDAPGPGHQVTSGGEPGHVHAGPGDGVPGGAAPPPGHRLGLLQLFLMRGQEFFDHGGEVADLGVDLAGALQHGLGQARMVIGEELRALQGVLQLGDLGPGAGAGQLREGLRVALAGGEVVHDVAAGDAVQVRDD